MYIVHIGHWCIMYICMKAKGYLDHIRLILVDKTHVECSGQDKGQSKKLEDFSLSQALPFKLNCYDFHLIM